MATTTVNGRLVNPVTQLPVSGTVAIVLVDYAGVPAHGFDATDQAQIMSAAVIRPADDGNWTVQLAPSANLQTASGAATLWQVTESGAGVSDTYYINVPSTGPAWVGAIRTQLPGSVGPGPLAGLAVVNLTVSGGLTYDGLPIAAPPNDPTRFLSGDGTWRTGGAVSSVNGHVGVVNLAAADVSAIPTAAEGAAGGVATLDGTSHLPLAQMASGTPSVGATVAATSSSAAEWVSAVGAGHWVFDVRAYGAKGDGKVATDATTSIGSNVVTCASGPFSPSDVGKQIQIKGALASGATTLCTTITGYTSATAVTMGANATAALSGNGLVLWATDDTAAIQATINAAFAHGQQQGVGIVSIPPAAGWFYGVAGALVAGGAAAANGQLVIPVQPDTANKVELIFLGATDGGTTRHWHQKMPQMSGSTLVSFGVFANATAQTNSLTASGNPAVISGQTGAYGYGGDSLLYNNVLVRLKGLQIYTPHSANGWTYGVLNMHGVAACCLEDFGYGTTGTYAAGDFSNPNGFSAGLSIGVLLPSAGNNDNNQLTNVICHGGYTRAIFLTEHSDWNGGVVLYCWSGICPVGNYDDAGSGHANPGVGASHGVQFEQISVEGCNQAIEIIGPGQAGIGPMISGSFDTEGQTVVRDTLSGMVAACGTLYLKGNGGTPPVLGAGTNLQVICEFQFPGPVASPPALTINTPVQNPYGRWASVTMKDGTGITSVQLGLLMGGPSAPTMRNVFTQTAAAMPLHTVRVPPQGWIQVNGSTAPTTLAWVLE